ncbi:GCG_CRPN prefix-to-repeats domain-containing protein [Legionella sp. CNM-1927-20]|uniref:GCG_CRPN prefix-to-repeats domain-containing protein n=1 Tax=Legionella sp. CNM-1927-20 TaxID=3422221 RepID=UPI00403AB4BF
MEGYSNYLSKFIGTFIVGIILILDIFAASPSYAAQGCGFGYHMTYFGRCVPNHPGPYATPVPGRPDCWVNARGFLRCWR